jgi:hypothetical protein
MKLGGTWTQVQASPTGVRGADAIKIVRGRTDEQQTTSQQPSTCDMSLNNRDGRYSPRNPSSPYYGQIGRNTPIRVSVPGDGTTYCRVPGTYGQDNASCPDSTGLHITGDIDIRIDVSLADPVIYQTLAVKGDWGGQFNGFTPSQAGWIFYVAGSGQLRFAWSSNGTSSAGIFSSTASLSASQANTRIALRVTLQVNNGSGGNTVTFYTASTIAGPWTQLGSALVTSGTTSIFASNQPIVVGEAGTRARTQNLSIMSGRLYAFQLLNGIGGAVVASPSFSTQAIGTTSFADAQGNTWTLNGDMEITNRKYRFYGEVSSFPPKWDTSGSDIYTPIEAAGVLRRYSQGTLPVLSPIRRATTTSVTPPVIYWPCEDPAGSSSFAVGAGSGQVMNISGSPSLASDTHIGGSAALPTLSNSTWTGVVPAYTVPGTPLTHVSMVMYLNSAPANNAIMARIFFGPTRVDIGYTTTSPGGIWSNIYDSSSGTLLSVDSSGTVMNATPLQTVFCFDLQVQNIPGFVVTPGVFLSSGDYEGQGNGISGRTVQAVTQIVINPNGTLTDTVVGHITVYNSTTGPNALVFPPECYAMTGNAGETAGARFVRLCFENGVQPRTVGDTADSPAMGPQGVDSFLNLVQSCIDADDGMLYEPQDVLGLGMRMRSSLYSQAPKATLSHTANQLSAVPEPIDDDQLIRNNITLTRTNGSYARAVLTTGTLSVNAPPNGVGDYPDTPTINYQLDSQLLNEASWRMHVGTVDESRWPLITTGMHTYEMVANPSLALAVQGADVGDVITLTGMPTFLPPSDTNQLVQGLAETLSNFEFTIAFNCSPASPYDSLVCDDATFGRLDTDGSTLQTGVNTTATTLSVSTTNPASPLWTTSAGDFPFDITIDGEQMTVTNITGTSSPQTFTVTRSVKGIVKSHSAGAAVTLQRPMYFTM